MASTLLSRILPGKTPRYLAAILFSLVALAFSYFKVFELYELQTYDWRCQLRGPRPVSPKIVLIDIADDSIAKIGQWPFDRYYHGALIEAMRVAGAKAVIFDVLFAEPGSSDAEVAELASKAGNVYFAKAFKSPTVNRARVHSEGVLIPLIEEYAASAKAIGYVNAWADQDGKRRRIPPMIFTGDKPFYQISLRVAMDLEGISKEDVKWHKNGYIEFGQERIPLDEDGLMIVNYAGKWEKTFRHYSYADIIRSVAALMENSKPEINLEELKDAICFVGFTATASHDTNANPLEPIYPNVGIHANVLNSILNRDFIARANRLTNTLVVILLGFLVAWVCAHNRPLKALVYALLVLALYVMVVVALFIWLGWWVDLFYPVLISILIYAGVTLSRVLFEMRKRELMENELKIASQIQKSFLPETLPQEPGLKLAVYMKPAKAIGGDLYTFVPVAPKKLGVMAGDVSGKGTPAALFMSKVVSEFKFSARQKENPAEVLHDLNNWIATESTGGLFVTLAYAIFDMAARRVYFSNGGHLPVVQVNSSGKSDLLSANEGMPIGVMDGVEFTVLEKEVQAGDVYALYSDGVSEARNRRKGEYGIERLQTMILNNRDKDAETILNTVVADLNHFMGKAEQHDDITLIIVKVE